MQAAGIFMAVAAGNDGPACGTAGVPPANYASAFTVGAVDSSDSLVFFSSRGPVDSLLKPQISAPGWNVRSSIPGGLYTVASGTSMAAPHVAGAVALLWSADPSLIGDIDRTAALLTESAVPETLSAICPADPGQRIQCLCGSDTATTIPNNGYGAGIVNAYRAYQLLKTGNP
jgi:subtilisin family serine protease